MWQVVNVIRPVYDAMRGCFYFLIKAFAKILELYKFYCYTLTT